jgi:DNA-binding MarR family transcriptional regulator
VTDPSEEGLWRPLRLLLAHMDDDIARLYAGTDIKPTYVLELLRLHHRGPMTIRELAESVRRTHSALSQKVAAMKAAGLVEVAQGEDARSKRVSLTPSATAMAGRLAAEWRATEAASAELEAELPYALSQVVRDMEAALARRSFHDRIAARLADDPAWRQ